MSRALEIALTGIIDYAGTFPPAQLSLAEAVANFQNFQSGTESWIINRFICPVKSLPQLTELLEKSEPKLPFPVSVLGSGGEGIDAWQTALEADSKLMNAFDSQWEERAPIEAYEVRSPGLAGLTQALSDIRAFDHIDVYFELSLGATLEEELAACAETEWVKAKARSGSVIATDVPSSQALAEFLKQALDLDISFKLTAGLHDPVRHFENAVGANLHGFLNVLASCALHLERTLTVAEIAEILDDSSDDHFSFDGDSLHWQQQAISMFLLAEVRDRFESFGSCSVDEPLDGLKRMGYAIVKA